MPHLAINNVCNDITNVEECYWDMGNCCGRVRMMDCMICECHLPLSEALNGTTYQWSAVNYRNEWGKLAIASMRFRENLFYGNWQ